MLVEQELKQKLSAYFVRHETLGYDRHNNRYWFFSMEPDKIFVELSPEQQQQLQAASSSRSSSSSSSSSSGSSSSSSSSSSGGGGGGGGGGATTSSAAQSQWGFFPLSFVAKHLDELDVRGLHERALREELLRVAREAGRMGSGSGGNGGAGGNGEDGVASSRDSIDGSGGSGSSSSSSSSGGGGGGGGFGGSFGAGGGGSGGGNAGGGEDDPAIEIHVMEGNEHIGSRVRRLFPGAEAQDGTIVSWLPPGEDPTDEPLWHVVHDDGDEEDLDADELKTALEACVVALRIPPTNETLPCCCCANSACAHAVLLEC